MTNSGFLSNNKVLKQYVTRSSRSTDLEKGINCSMQISEVYTGHS